MKSNEKNINDVLKNKPELLFIIQTLSDKSNTDINLITKFNSEEFIRLIKHHRLDSIFYKAIKEQNVKLPNDLEVKLSDINKRNKMRMMKLTVELIRIHKFFTENNIDYISLKGPALSQQIYGDYTIRNSRDLDILVKEEDFIKASNLLKLLNYKNNKKFNSINKFNYKEFKFINSETKILVELHHRLFNNKYLLPIENQDFSSSQFVKINNINIPILPNKLNFEYIDTHAAAHNWMRMVWSLDILSFKKTDKNNYSLEDFVIISSEKQLKLFSRMLHLLKLNNSFKYKVQEILQRLFIPYRFFDNLH